MPPREAVEAGPELTGPIRDPRQRFFQQTQAFERHAARQRPAAKRRPVRVEREVFGGLLGEQRGPEWQSPCQGFRGHDNIGPDAGPLVAEILSRPAQAALRFVSHQQRSQPLGQFPRLAQKLGL
jgi:hypothetical protein